MSLPILQTRSEPAPIDLLRYFGRTELHWAQHLGAEMALDFGTAIVNRQLPLVRDANQVLELALPPGWTPEKAVQHAEEIYAAQGSRCRKWMMNPAAPAEQVRPMAEYLLVQHYVEEAADVLYLRHGPRGKVVEVAGLTIIPARASYRHTQELLEQSSAWAGGEIQKQLAEGKLTHLDDPHLDALLALKQGRPVGYVGVLSVGELGRIEPLYVAEGFRRQGIGRTMMSRALEVCARSLFRHVFITVEPGNEPAQKLYKQLGFEKIGRVTSYHLP